MEDIVGGARFVLQLVNGQTTQRWCYAMQSVLNSCVDLTHVSIWSDMSAAGMKGAGTALVTVLISGGRSGGPSLPVEGTERL